MTTAPEKSSRGDIGIAHAVGPIFLGLTIGYLTGASGNDSRVLAAVLPATLAAYGGLLIAFRFRGNTPQSENAVSATGIVKYTSLTVGLFSGALLCGSVFGDWVERHLNKRDAEFLTKQHAESLLRLHSAESNFQQQYFKYIETCSSTQFRINMQRNTADLEPLTFEQVCPGLEAYFLFPQQQLPPVSTFEPASAPQ